MQDRCQAAAAGTVLARERRAMWLIERGSDGQAGRRISLPIPVREALVRWYSGTGDGSDEAAGIVLVQQARIGKKWLACDCLAAPAPPPIMTPAFLSEAETYYLRRLTAHGRPEHDLACPFFRDQATNRVSEVRRPGAPAAPPYGLFEVLRPAPEKLAQRPGEESIDDRTRHASVPRLARLLWRLLDLAGLNRCLPLGAATTAPTIAEQFARLRSVAGRIEIAPGIELGRLLWTHAGALRSREVFAALRSCARTWPTGHAPQAFLALFAREVRGAAVHIAGGPPVLLANRVQTPSLRENPIDGPYLVLVVIGAYPESHGYAPLRGYAQPILSGRQFIPVDTRGDRDLLQDLLAIRYRFDRAGIDLHIEKPVFDLLTPAGPCRPDVLLEARCRATGTRRRLVISRRPATGIGSDPEETRRLKAIAPILALGAGPPVTDRLQADLLQALRF